MLGLKGVLVFSLLLAVATGCGEATTLSRLRNGAESQSPTEHRAPGGWIGGGGELVGDAGNPWFVKNVKRVPYCIEVSDRFGVQSASLGVFVKEALDAWKHEFSLAGFEDNGIATQDFVQVKCAGKEPLVFQFGVIHRDQRKRIQGLENYLSLTVRTEYDPVSMSGKGFVYFKPQDASGSEGAVRDPWSRGNGVLLRLAILHELGHVFGVPHNASGFLDVTSRTFVEEITSKNLAQHVIERMGINPLDSISIANPRTFKVLMGDSILVPDEAGDPVFGLPPGWRYEAISASPEGVVRAWGKPTLESEWELLGSGQSTSSSRFAYQRSQVFLPPQQKVFSEPGRWIPGLNSHTVSYYVDYEIIRTGERRQVSVYLDGTDAPHFSAVVLGKLSLDLFAYSPELPSRLPRSWNSRVP